MASTTPAGAKRVSESPAENEPPSQQQQQQQQHTTSIDVTGATGNAKTENTFASGITNIGTFIQLSGDVSFVTPEASSSKGRTPNVATTSSSPLPADKDYHVFFCFNKADQEWVDYARIYLESPEIGFKCVDHRRDFHAGKATIKNIEEFIEKSWKYVLVVSPDFVKSDWCSFETDIIVNMSEKQLEEFIVPVLLKPCTIPKALKSLTYIDVAQSFTWREKLVRDIKRADISSQKLQKSKIDMQTKKEEARKNISAYKQFIDNYLKEKKQLELEKRSLESSVHNCFSVLSRQILAELAKEEERKIRDIHKHMDKRLAVLMQRIEKAEKILAEVNKDLDDKALKNFTNLLEEYEELERRQTETCFTEYVASTSLVEQMTQLMSEMEPGYLREMQMDITQIKTQEDRDNFLKEISPSWAILPTTVELTPWSVIRCPHFQFDPMTVQAGRSILPQTDGSLYNQPPSRPHPQSDRRLKKYMGAVGTSTFTAGRVYYWQNSVDVDLEKELKETNLVFEVGLSARGVIDDKHFIRTYVGTISMIAARCTNHTTDRVCLEVHKDNVEIYHQTLHPNTTGHWSPLILGFFLDTMRNRWTIYDVTKQEEITTVEDIGYMEDFIPMFGVYSPHLAKIKLSLITGTDLNISDDMYRLIQRALK